MKIIITEDQYKRILKEDSELYQKYSDLMDEVISNHYSEGNSSSEELLPMLVKTLNAATMEVTKILNDETMVSSPEIEKKINDEYDNLRMRFDRIMDFLRIEDPDLNSKIRDIVRRYESSGSWI